VRFGLSKLDNRNKGGNTKIVADLNLSVLTFQPSRDFAVGSVQNARNFETSHIRKDQFIIVCFADPIIEPWALPRALDGLLPGDALTIKIATP
jgi:hypothetical protein